MRSALSQASHSLPLNSRSPIRQWDAFDAEELKKAPEKPFSLADHRIAEAVQVGPQQRQSQVSKANAENQEVVFMFSAYLPAGAVNGKHQRLTGRLFHKTHVLQRRIKMLHFLKCDECQLEN
ncbi:MAG: hypothetical protein LBT97_10655 [Planctomycetota bacterium]|jgi:hypothetical protein|nr:hypothetical protein [Planctomycetota bacterium]